MEQKLEQILTNCNRMYQRVKERHYKAVLTGDGTNSLKLNLPFQPDLLQVACTDPRIMSHVGAVIFFNGDFNGIGRAAGTTMVTRVSGPYNLIMTTTTVENRLDGGCLTNIKDGTADCTFPEGLIYQVVATKIDDRSLKERYTEFVESLTGSGTAEVCKAKIDQAFTAQEWSDLIATKPGWTFKEV